MITRIKGRILNTPAVKTEGLTKIYSNFWRSRQVTALIDLNLQIERGEVFGLLGPNGSGKTTTVKLLLGLINPTRGKSWLLGYPSCDLRIKSRIGFLPEESYLYRFLNTEEILDFYGKLFGIAKRERKRRIDMLIHLVGLDSARRRPLHQYSKGMLRRVGLAQAIINDPELIILDEPTSGLDPVGNQEIKELILELKRQGKAIVLCSHLMADVQTVCDRIAILNKGILQIIGNVRELLSRTDSLELQIQNLSEADIQAVEEFIKSKNGNVLSVGRPLSTLEEVFLNIVRRH